MRPTRPPLQFVWLPQGEKQSVPEPHCDSSAGTSGGAVVGCLAQPVLVIACGALANEILNLKRLNHWHHLKLRCLDASLHNRPEKIVPRLREAIRRGREEFKQLFVAYADCGTAGGIDRLLEEEGVDRLPGAHCYAAYAGVQRFAQWSEQVPGTFYLTDFLVAQFEQLVVRGLKLDRYPQLRDSYFGHYQRVLYLSQRRDPALLAAAREAAGFLDLAFEHEHCGYGELESSLQAQLILRA
jgi:hypothetical protein